MNVDSVGPLAAFLGGLLSFVSPCVFPMVPIYLSMITGYSVKELQERNYSVKALLIPTLLFVLGFTCSFVLLGATATTVGDLLSRNYVLFRKIVGVLMVFWGVMLVGLIKPGVFFKNFTVNKGKTTTRLGIFVMGVAFGLSWSPCVGAILVPILSMAALKETVFSGIFLLFCYSMGIAVPLVIASIALAKSMSLLSGVQAHYKKIEVVTGALVVLFGVYLFMGGRI
ncbi:cytochrome c-type biogenesis protein [Thermosulfidibacter takaii ABI70S6]|uniref:Cytochrome c-type biogenesis protein n=1 Tax=Thermosulfidibacter takaii (strain DSM 17441 / JCM 13301 / NBRC 103674 / ABI70S6) TaxID=1298851 RepID=A0A0S3QTJ9_THET7|nr:cytochrome c biogenesis CcdA family protein [Thermosulfidibacter takaii]BAT71656.1 cytochrome c-type biogenesis protein [Thermosulfidibacter takaii ABI70S6]